MTQQSAFLLVEDHAAAARAIANVLSPYRPVRAATSVGEAFAVLDGAQRFCGLVVDVALPDGSGLDVLTGARSRGVAAAAVVVSAHLSRDLVNRAFELQAGYLCKPVGAAELRTFVVRALTAEALPARDAAERVREVSRRHGLSPRETELLAFAVARRSRREILDAMGVTDNTLKGAVRSLLLKLDAANLDDAAVAVLSDALIDDRGARVPRVAANGRTARS